MALDNTASAISAKIVAAPICELAIEPLQFDHVPKEAERRLACNEVVRDKAGSAVLCVRLDRLLWKDPYTVVARIRDGILNDIGICC